MVSNQFNVEKYHKTEVIFTNLEENAWPQNVENII